MQSGLHAEPAPIRSCIGTEISVRLTLGAVLPRPGAGCGGQLPTGQLVTYRWPGVWTSSGGRRPACQRRVVDVCERIPVDGIDLTAARLAVLAA